MVEIDTGALVTGLHSEKAVANLLEFAVQLQEARGYRHLSLAWQEIAEAGASRIGQLNRYRQKRRNADAKFRPYKPLKLSATERGNVERAARAEGIATEQDPSPWRCAYRDDQNRRCFNPRSEVSTRCESGEHKF